MRVKREFDGITYIASPSDRRGKDESLDWFIESTINGSPSPKGTIVERGGEFHVEGRKFDNPAAALRHWYYATQVSKF